MYLTRFFNCFVVPGMVRNINVVEKNETMLKIEWIEPREPNGVIESNVIINF